MYATIHYHLVNLFSLRAAPTNAFTARTLPCPTPATVKLALLAKLIERDAPGQSPEALATLAQQRLTWLAPLRVGWYAPPLMTISAATMTVLKEDNGKTPLIRSVGMREYAHFNQSFGLTLGPVTDAARRSDLEDALLRLRALGVAESLVQPLGPPTWSNTAPGVADGCVGLTESASQSGPPDESAVPRDGGEAYVVDDLGRDPRFDRLSLYRPVDADHTPRLGEDRRGVIVTLPLRQRRQSISGRVLERIPYHP
jgi:hypothetical protein